MQLSAVIPTLDEADRIDGLIEALRACGVDEIVVADGGSKDSTCAVAAAVGAHVVETARGRGRQLRAGALATRGEALIFLHADSAPPRELRAAVLETLAQPGVAGGSFCLAFDEQHPLLSFYARVSRINHPLVTYGDQGLFLTRATYDRIGGYSDAPLFEDAEILRRLRTAGRFVKRREAMVTSARRFRRDGIARRELTSIALVSLFHMGVPPAQLERWYRPEREHRQ